VRLRKEGTELVHHVKYHFPEIGEAPAFTVCRAPPEGMTDRLAY
jgi:hypothetical protein